MPEQAKFYFDVAGFTLGIFLSSFFKMGFSFFLFLLLLSVIMFLYTRINNKSSVFIILTTTFIFFLSLGILRYEIKEIRNNSSKLSYFVDQKILLKGLVIEEPKIKDQGADLVIATESVISQDKEIESVGKVLVSTGLFPEFKYGDLIEVKGKLTKPENFVATSSNDFDYVNYLAKDDIFYKISFAEARLISSGHGSSVKNAMFAIKNAFTDKLNLLIKEPESSLLGGLLLGAKNSLGKELQDDFRLAGVSHIVALSGYNITIIAESIMVSLAFLPGPLATISGVIGIILFAIMTGAGATVVRASVMALLVLLARSTNRTYDITRALLLAGVFMLIQNPKILVFDVSFQLSFLATIALIFVSPIIEKRVRFITEKYKLRELIVSTVSTQIFVLPFIFYKMGLVSAFGLFTNVLILPVIPLIMLLGFGVGLFGFISVSLATPIAFVCSLLLSYVLKVIQIFSHLPLAAINIDNFSLSLTVLIYAIFIVIIWWENNNQPAILVSRKVLEKYETY